jgi:predicted ester cyclase
MTTEETRAIMQAYWAGDESLIAEDAEFVDMAGAQRSQGRAAIVAMIDAFYGEIFSGTFEPLHAVVEGGRAVLEGHMVGTHNLPYAGIEPGERDVRLPMCIAYDLEGGLIRRARIYVVTESLRRAY